MTEEGVARPAVQPRHARRRLRARLDVPARAARAGRGRARAWSSAAARFVPELAGTHAVSVRACARPMSADGRPLLGPLPAAEGLFVATGHGPWGVSLGPGSARLVADAVLGATGGDRAGARGVALLRVPAGRDSASRRAHGHATIELRGRPRHPCPTPTGLAHVATVSFLAARAAPSAQFWLALAGGIALARSAALKGVRIGYGASAAAMLQTIAVMGPARMNGAAHPGADGAAARRAAPARHERRRCRSSACFAIRLTHYVVLTAALVWIVLGGLDAYAGSYDTLTGWLGILPEGERGALIVTVVLNVALAIFYSVTQVLVYRWALGSWPAAAPPALAPAAGPARGPRLGALRPARDHARRRGGVRAAAERHGLGPAGQRRRVAGARVGGVALRPRGARRSASR